MNVLFILNQSHTASIVKFPSIFSIVRKITLKEISIGLVTNSIRSVPLIWHKKIKLNEELQNGSWDIIVVQDEDDIKYISSINFRLLHRPIVLFLEQTPNQPFYLKFAKWLIIAIYSKDHMIDDGIPPHRILELPILDGDLIFKKYQKGDICKILYYVEEDSDLRNVIAFAKHIQISTRDFQLFVLCNDHIKSMLQKIVGDHVILIDLQIARSYSFSIALASGKIAMSTIRCRIPTIVVGKYGFGSLVTPQNIERHVANNFQGRLGGYCREPIPPAILLSEIIMGISYKNKERNYLNDNQIIINKKMDDSQVDNLFLMLSKLVGGRGF